MVLPSAQTNNTVYAVAVARGKIFLGGDFTTVRAAGLPLGSHSAGRTGFAVLSSTTGAVLGLSHRFLDVRGKPAQIQALATSPSGAVLFVGGTFTSVDGQPRGHVAAVNTVSGALKPRFGVGGVNGDVLALAVTASTVCVGGQFSASGTTRRTDVAAFATTGALLGFDPVLAGGAATLQPTTVLALDVSSTQKTVYVGGTFDTVNHAGRHAFDGVDGVTGGVDDFATGVGIPADSYVTTIIHDRTRVFIGGRADNHHTDRFEGVKALTQTTGSTVWSDRCYGDTFALAELAGYLYVGSHAHDCSAIGGWPETTPRHYQALRAVDPATGALLSFYPQVQGSARVNGSQDLTRGLGTDGTQLVAVGGWVSVDGRASQNIARFSGAGPGSPPRIPGVSAAVVNHHPVVTFHTVYDYDSTQLTYRLYRAGHAPVLIYSHTIYSVFWNTRSIPVLDRTARAGRRAQYYVTVSDGHNTVRSATTTPVIP